MSLTEYALYERIWGKFPELATLLSQKQLSVGWTGPTSVSDSLFNQINRIFHIYALVRDNEKLVEQAVMEIGDPVRRELMELSHTLASLSDRFAEASQISAQLAHRQGKF
jgi:hypothetical protein